jgi:hypothetical protein
VGVAEAAAVAVGAVDGAAAVAVGAADGAAGDGVADELPHAAARTDITVSAVIPDKRFKAQPPTARCEVRWKRAPYNDAAYCGA